MLNQNAETVSRPPNQTYQYDVLPDASSTVERPPASFCVGVYTTLISPPVFVRLGLIGCSLLLLTLLSEPEQACLRAGLATGGAFMGAGALGFGFRLFDQCQRHYVTPDENTEEDDESQFYGPFHYPH